MQKENSTWTAQRIQGELVKLGLDVSDNTVAKYMRKFQFIPEAFVLVELGAVTFPRS